MPYSHDFEIKMAGVTVEGEISFDHGSSTTFRTTTGEEMTIQQHQRIQDILQMFSQCASAFQDVEKIELTKK